MSATSHRCAVCRAMLDEEDLFCVNCGTEAPHPSEPRAADKARTTTCNFHCEGCGASMSYDATQQALACPFCASVKLVAVSDAKVLAPEAVVPMAISSDAAVAAMRRWLSKGFWRPGDLSQAAMVVKARAVYVPYWVFAATTHTYWTADTNKTPFGARGDWMPLFGEHQGRYAGVLVGASGALTPAETNALCPFDLAQGVPPERVDLDAVTVEEFALQRKLARPLAHQGIEELERQACDVAYVPGTSRNVKVNTMVEGMSSRPVLLPVWIMAYRYRDAVFRLLVNGQTGAVTGAAPISVKKILAVIGIVLLVIVLLLLVLSMK